jgi:cytochrome c553
MSFRSAGFRNAVLGSATALAFALASGGATAQAAAPKSAASSSKTSAPAVASTAAQPASASTSAATPSAAAPAPAHTAPQRGQAKAAVCGACHGIDGNSSDPQYPKLAGQGEAYIAHQLASFKAGKRQNPIMLGMATPLSPQDMQNVGAYFASQKVIPGVADQSLVDKGQTLFREGDPTHDVPACMACHSMDGSGNPGAGYPQLAGQHAQYIQATLKAWHDGTVWGTDAHSQIMPAIAQKLDANDIAALASYVEGLHSAAATAAPATP